MQPVVSNPRRRTTLLQIWEAAVRLVLAERTRIGKRRKRPLGSSQPVWKLPARLWAASSEAEVFCQARPPLRVRFETTPLPTQPHLDSSACAFKPRSQNEPTKPPPLKADPFHKTSLSQKRPHNCHIHIPQAAEGQQWRWTQAKILERFEEEMTKPEEVPDSPSKRSSTGGHDRPLVVGRTKPASISNNSNVPVSADTKAALNHAIEMNVQSNTKTAAPAEGSSEPSITVTPSAAEISSKPATKKEKAPKQPKQSKAAPPTAPFTPALIDLRVGHILRCVTHPNADSLFVSTIAMGDAEGADHTQIDEETGKVVRTVCSGLNGLIPIEEMQDRKIVVVANLKPVTMRGIKSAAMVLAASPKVAEGEDDHAADRTVELVVPPVGSEAGDKVYFEGWPYGEGKGPEKQLNPKKKVWEGIQPGFYTSEELVVRFDAGASEVEGEEKGDLVVEGKGKCTVKTLKGAVVR